MIRVWEAHNAELVFVMDWRKPNFIDSSRACLLHNATASFARLKRRAALQVGKSPLNQKCC